MARLSEGRMRNWCEKLVKSLKTNLIVGLCDTHLYDNISLNSGLNYMLLRRRKNVLYLYFQYNE